MNHPFFWKFSIKFLCCYYSTNAYEDIKDGYKKFYKDLEMNKILFISKSKIINHIFNIWDNVEDWWFSENVQKSIEYFNI